MARLPERSARSGLGRIYLWRLRLRRNRFRFDYLGRGFRLLFKRNGTIGIDCHDPNAGYLVSACRGEGFPEVTDELFDHRVGILFFHAVILHNSLINNSVIFSKKRTEHQFFSSVRVLFFDERPELRNHHSTILRNQLF